jgi:uncharacterized PurR-regulated membrane protein YhhQ (DUF165 family)
MEINKHHYHFNRRIVAIVLFIMLALSYLVLTLVVVPDRNQADSTETHHERQV